MPGMCCGVRGVLMTAQQYALEAKGLPMWHAVKVVSHTSPEVIGMCGHRFTLTSRVTTDQPDVDSFCAGCKNAERIENAERNLRQTHEEIRLNVATPTPASNEFSTPSTPKKETAA